MKTPEEIKKGLECCSDISCSCEGVCPYFMVDGCLKQCKDDALAYIQQLESRLAQVERERDAAVRDMTRIAVEFDSTTCEWCKHKPYNHTHCKECRTENEGFEWRGVCPENTKEEAK